MKKQFFVLAGVVLAIGANADVSTLTAKMTVDNGFEAYLSTSATSLGTQFMSGANWQQTFSGSVAIPAGGTYYLHVRAIDVGLPAMFIGQFDLSGTNAVFAVNGTNQVLSSISTFTTSGGPNVGDSVATAFDRGANGAGPWGTVNLVDPAARFVWARNAAGGEFSGGDNPLFFTTEIRAVPEPASLLAMAIGTAALLRRRARAA